MATIFKISLFLFLLEFSMISNTAQGVEKWSSAITYNDIVSKAQAGSAYYQGLLGIYLRSGEAGSKVNIPVWE